MVRTTPLVLAALLALPFAAGFAAPVEPELLLVMLEEGAPVPTAGDAWRGGVVAGTIPEIRTVALLGVTDAEARALARLPTVEHVLRDRPDAFTLAGAPAPADPRWPDQWGPQRIGVLGAWETTRGSREVVVAVIDSGLDVEHVDFAGVNVLPGLNVSGIETNGDVTDFHGHGTHVTGTIAAAIGNGEGVAGLADVSILPVKALCGAPSGCGAYVFGIARGFVLAATQGADVITVSLNGGDDPFTEAAVKFAHAKGAFLSASSGNDGCVRSARCNHFPAAYPEVVAVGCSTPSDTRCPFSNGDLTLDIVAPGEGIWSTLPGDQYASWSGTSMSTPHVAGVAALLMSARPDATNDEVRAWLEDGAQPLGRTIEYGHGRLDAAASMRLALAS